MHHYQSGADTEFQKGEKGTEFDSMSGNWNLTSKARAHCQNYVTSSVKTVRFTYSLPK